MASADELNRQMRLVLKRYIEGNFGSVQKAADVLGTSRGALRLFLEGTNDTGLERSLGWGEKLGLSPRPWIRETGLFPENGTYAQLLRTSLALPQRPKDPLLVTCAELAARLRLPMPETLRIPEEVVEIDDRSHEDPRAAAELATKHLKAALSEMRRAKRRPGDLDPESAARFFMLAGVYAVRKHITTRPSEAAWGVAFACEYFQARPSSPPLTWLLIDGSTILRRLFRADEALQLAKVAAAEALGQDARRLFPRALLALASVLFYRGNSKAAAELDKLVLRADANPYQPIAAYSMAVALAEIDTLEAARALEEYVEILNLLPPHRQMQRHWTAGRVFSALGEREKSFESYVAALEADWTTDDKVVLFLIFDEACQVVGVDDPRLDPLAEGLRPHLQKMSFEFPDAFLAAERYLAFLRMRDEEGMRRQVEHLNQLRSQADGRIPPTGSQGWN